MRRERDVELVDDPFRTAVVRKLLARRTIEPIGQLLFLGEGEVSVGFENIAAMASVQADARAHVAVANMRHFIRSVCYRLIGRDPDDGGIAARLVPKLVHVAFGFAARGTWWRGQRADQAPPSVPKAQ